MMVLSSIFTSDIFIALASGLLFLIPIGYILHIFEKTHSKSLRENRDVLGLKSLSDLEKTNLIFNSSQLVISRNTSNCLMLIIWILASYMYIYIYCP